jgi:tetratricopeptide (TPR) repeat protein
MSFSLCLAAESPVEKAYDLFYQGKSEQAIELIEDYVKDTPDASAYYFLGYAYYEKNEIDKAMEYFSKSFKLKTFYSPMEQKE